MRRSYSRSGAGAALLAIVGVLGGCADGPPNPYMAEPVWAPPSSQVVRVYEDAPLVQPDAVFINVAPPPMLVEVMPPRPSYDAVWIGGYWGWQSRWVWCSGRWAPPPRPGYAWMNPYYENRGGIVVFVPGYWRAPNAVFMPPPPRLRMPVSVSRNGGVPPIGPSGTFVPPPPGSRPGTVVPAPIGSPPRWWHGQDRAPVDARRGSMFDPVMRTPTPAVVAPAPAPVTVVPAPAPWPQNRGGMFNRPRRGDNPVQGPAETRAPAEIRQVEPPPRPVAVQPDARGDGRPAFRSRPAPAPAPQAAPDTAGQGAPARADRAQGGRPFGWGGRKRDAAE